MKERLKKGDLVLIRTEPEKFGIVVDILMRSPTNADWDAVLVMSEGSVESFSPRRLQLKEK
jgi:hypothetical protein